MVIPSPRQDALGSRRQGVPIDWYDPDEHRRKLAEELNITSAQLQDLVDFVRDHVSVAIYGGMRTSGTSASYSLGAGYTKYTDFDTISVTPKGTTFNTTTDTFQINANGIYVIFIGFAFEHNETNAGRKFNVRLFNETDSVQIGNPIAVGVGRNTPATNFGYQFLTSLTDANEDDNIAVQLGGGDSINGTFDSFELSVYSIGEIQGTAGDITDPADPNV